MFSFYIKKIIKNTKIIKNIRSIYNKPYVYLYDTTLRDGLQTAKIDITLEKKQLYMKEILPYNFDFHEIGMIGDLHDKELNHQNYPRTIFLCLPTSYYINKAYQLNIKQIQFVIKADIDHISQLFHKNHEQYIKESIEMIQLAQKNNIYTICALEHFFDGYKKNPIFAKTMIQHIATYCHWIVLADTNGGTLPHEIETILQEVNKIIPLSRIGIHAHNDMDLAVANSITAIRTGVRMVQGTWNGMGERCGNANLISIACIINFKLKYNTCLSKQMNTLTKSSRIINELFGNRSIYSYTPFVGTHAFTHKAGLHIHAVTKNSQLYEHITPENIGNKQTLLLSSSIGRKSLVSILGELPDINFLPIAKHIIHTIPIEQQKEQLIQHYKLFIKNNNK